MTDELRAAVERLRDGPLHYTADSDLGSISFKQIQDLMLIRSAYLAEHPAENVQACPYCGKTYELHNDGLAINLAEHIMRAHSDT